MDNYEIVHASGRVRGVTTDENSADIDWNHFLTFLASEVNEAGLASNAARHAISASVKQPSTR